MKKPILISVVMYLIFFWQLLLPNFSFWKSDAELIYLPARFYIYEKITQEKSFPFWTERMFSGFPIYADFENAYLNPINVLSILLFGPIYSYKILHFFSYLIGSLCLYYWLKNKGYNLVSFSIANLIFYFNTFMLNHQIHFNVIAGFYLFPSILFLIDEIINKFEIKKIIFLSLTISYIALWGHAQTTFMICFGGLIYFIFYSFKNLNLRKSIYFAVLSTLLILMQIIPQYLPSFNLYQDSLREETINFRQGSLTPELIALTFIPNLFGKSYNYIGNKLIYTEYTYTETYIYLGISSILLAILGIFFIKKDKFFFFLYSYILIFFFLAFNAFNPLLNENTPILNIFRYWQRSMLFFSFAVAILASTLVQNLYSYIYDKKDFIKSTFYVVFPIIYLYIISLFPNNFLQAFKKDGVFKITEILSYKNLVNIEDFFIVVIIGFVTLILVYFLYQITYFQKFIPKKLLLFGVFVIIFLDLKFFNLDVLEYRIDNISNYKLPKLDEKYSNIRVYNKTLALDGMEHTLVNSWNPFGYSQFKEKEYSKLFFDSGLSNLRKAKDAFPKDRYPELEKFGIKYLLENENETEILKNNVDLVLQNIEGEVFSKKEGEVDFKLNSQENQKIILFLKYNKNWNILINNQPVNFSKEGLFIGLNIYKGENLIKVKYVPKDFYLGLLLSILLLLPSLILIKFKDKLIND